jgi:hypothetical protein
MALAAYYRRVDGGAIAELLAGLADEPCFAVPVAGAAPLSPLAVHRGRVAVTAMFKCRGVLPIRHEPFAAVAAGDRFLVSGTAFDRDGGAVADFFVTAGLDPVGRLETYVAHAAAPQAPRGNGLRPPSDAAFRDHLDAIAAGVPTTWPAAFGPPQSGCWREQHAACSATAALASGTIERRDGSRLRVACRLHGGPTGAVLHAMMFANACDADG